MPSTHRSNGSDDSSPIFGSSRKGGVEVTTDFTANNTSSNMCGCTIMNNQDGYSIAQVMRTKPNVHGSPEFPSMIRVDASGRWSSTSTSSARRWATGEGEFTQANFEEVMSTHYGRMINLDDRTLFFANPEDAAEYLGFDLQRSERREAQVYEKDGERYYIVDGHIHFWDGSPENQANKYGKGFIECFYDYHRNLSRPSGSGPSTSSRSTPSRT